MKKILILNTVLDKGGAAKVAKSIFDGLKNDFEIHFAYGRGGKNKTKNTFYFGNKIEMFLHILIIRFFGVEGYGSHFATQKLIKYIKKEKFDIVNIHNLHGYYLNFFTLLKFLEKENIKVVFEMHDEWAINPRLAYSMNCSHCRDVIGKCTSKYNYPKSYTSVFDKYMLKKKKRMFLNFKKENFLIITPSETLKKEVENAFLNKFDIKCIYNSIDEKVFYPRENKIELKEKYNLPIDKKIFTFSAVDFKNSIKGGDFVLEIAKRFKENKNIIFLGIGSGVADLENVISTGYVSDQNKLAELYSIGDLYLNFSEAETFGLTIIENMHLNIPVLANKDLGAFRELVYKGAGFLIEKDIEKVFDFLDNFIKNKENYIYKKDDLLIEKTKQNTFLEEYKKVFNMLI